MYILLPPFIPLGICGALAGLLGGGCNQCFPVWVGAATGASLGCIISMCMMMMPEKQVNSSIQGMSQEPVIIHNTYITYVYGHSKDIPIAKIVTPSTM